VRSAAPSSRPGVRAHSPVRTTATGRVIRRAAGVSTTASKATLRAHTAPAMPKSAVSVPLDLILDPAARRTKLGDYAASGVREWDTNPVMIAARMQVRAHPAVLDAVARVAALLRWHHALTVDSASGRSDTGFRAASPMSASPSRDKDGDKSHMAAAGAPMSPGSPAMLHAESPGATPSLVLVRSEYNAMHRVIWELLQPSDAAGARDESLEADWERDVARQPNNAASLEAREVVLVDITPASRTVGTATEEHVTFAQFCEGLLEFADRWTSSADAGEAAELLSRLSEAAAPRLARARAV
jgi:hypothetical protein